MDRLFFRLPKRFFKAMYHHLPKGAIYPSAERASASRMPVDRIKICGINIKKLPDSPR